jgi:hypothetical protein
MWMGERSRMIRRKRKSEVCEEIKREGSPFIGARGGRGVRARSTVAMAFQGAKGQGDVRISFLVSRRFWGACW